MMVHLALYGTLRRGQPMLTHFAGAALDSGTMRWLGRCRIPGRLIDCGAYPALIDPGGTGPGVAADLFALSDPQLLAALDAYEEYDPAHPETSEYRRDLLPLIDGAVEGVGEAHAYIWNHPPGNLPIIESGDWLIHVGESPRDPPRQRPGGQQS